MSSIETLKARIKDWEYSFKKTHNRSATKNDIKANDKIALLYRDYKKLKLKSASTERQNSLGTPERKASLHINPDQREFSPVQSDDEDYDIRQYGPTPQLNGKIMGLFEIMNTPGSTPVKSTRESLDGVSFNNKNSPSKKLSIQRLNTPSKSPRRIDSVNSHSIPEELKSVKKLLMEEFASQTASLQPSPLTPIEKRYNSNYTKTKIMETPGYLSNGRVLKTPEGKRTSPLNPFIQFSLSPSPLKPQRNFGKRLSTMFKELQEIKEEQNDAATRSMRSKEEELEALYLQEDEILNELEGRGPEAVSTEKMLYEDEFLDEEVDVDEKTDNTSKVWKKKGQKRTTRRWKIKARNGDDEENDEFANKNIKKELSKLEEARQKHFEDYINDEGNEEEDYIVEEEQEPKKPAQQNSKGKLRNPYSNNYKRLKINDGRSKMFKARRGRGRR